MEVVLIKLSVSGYNGDGGGSGGTSGDGTDDVGSGGGLVTVVKGDGTSWRWSTSLFLTHQNCHFKGLPVAQAMEGNWTDELCNRNYYQRKTGNYLNYKITLL